MSRAYINVNCFQKTISIFERDLEQYGICKTSELNVKESNEVTSRELEAHIFKTLDKHVEGMMAKVRASMTWMPEKPPKAPKTQISE